MNFRKIIIFVTILAMFSSIALMSFSMVEAGRREDATHQVIGQCLEGYAVASFLHGHTWSFSQVFTRGPGGKLVPVLCGNAPFNHDHWR